MAQQKLSINEDLIDQICAAIHKGAFEADAAAFVGIPAETYSIWIARGLKPRPPDPLYKELVVRIEQAKAHARVKAAWKMMDDDTKAWLLQGPGKNDGSEQWTQPHKAPQVTNNQQINVTSDPQVTTMLQTILAALAQFPEAKASVAAALSGDDPEDMAGCSASLFPQQEQ
ncbi:MAG: hypothetical protein ACFCD0_23910 [Gemmataceae bacterium]